MAQENSIISTLTGKTANPIGRRAGIGGLFGLIAAIIGLAISAGRPLIPLPSMDMSIFQDPSYYLPSTAFLGLITFGLFLQMIGSKDLRHRLGSSYGYVLHLTFILGLVITIYLPLYAPAAQIPGQIESFLYSIQLASSFFLLFWQLSSLIFVDASESWEGFLAGLLNGFAFPFLALSQALGPTFAYLGYVLLLIGQFATLIFWWSPYSIIRQYARSTSKAKFAFGITGVVTILVGFLAAINGPIQVILDVEVWYPWSSLDSGGMFYTNPVLVEALALLMLFWVMLSPRLGAKELKEAHAREDLIKGGIKYFMILLSLVTIIAAGQAGSGLEGSTGLGMILTVCPCIVLFLMGGIYAASTDIIVGVPLILTAIFSMIHPFSLLLPIMIVWILAIITQFLLMVETIIRGLTSYSQAALSVITVLVSSIIFIIFLLGGFGAGPTAIWPTNRWFNISLLAGVPLGIQTPIIFVLPIIALLIRNVALAGFGHERQYSGGPMLMVLSAVFSLMIPLIAGSEGIVHQASTAAAILLALYALSFVMVLTLNLDLARAVEDEGHLFEGTFLRLTSTAGLISGAIVAVITLAVFAGFPAATDVALVITLLVTLIVGLEILLLIGWTSAGVRLGMLKQGFKFYRAENKL